MKLSKETLDILKNFSGINSNLVVKAGSTLKTIAEAKSILASAEVSENFGSDFGIYDLSQFLGAYDLIGDPDLKFEDGFLRMVGADSSVKYKYSPIDMLTQPKKDIVMPPVDVAFTISEGQLSKIRKAAGTLGYTTLAIEVENGEVNASVKDLNDSSANAFTLNLTNIDDKALKCTASFLISNLKLIMGDYTVGISSKMISQWENGNGKIKYWIALEQDSVFS